MKDDLNVGGFTELTVEEAETVDGGTGIIAAFVQTVGYFLNSCLKIATNMFVGK